jgi:hypothetical protein
VAEWFAPKRYGYGGGVPVAWQGWVITLAYLVTVVGATQLLIRSPWAMGSLIATATAVFLIVVVKNTRGGRRWRWGGRE